MSYLKLESQAHNFIDALKMVIQASVTTCSNLKFSPRTDCTLRVHLVGHWAHAKWNFLRCPISLDSRVRAPRPAQDEDTRSVSSAIPPQKKQDSTKTARETSAFCLLLHFTFFRSVIALHKFVYTADVQMCVRAVMNSKNKLHRHFLC